MTRAPPPPSESLYPHASIDHGGVRMAPMGNDQHKPQRKKPITHTASGVLARYNAQFRAVKRYLPTPAQPLVGCVHLESALPSRHVMFLKTQVSHFARVCVLEELQPPHDR